MLTQIPSNRNRGQMVSNPPAGNPQAQATGHATRTVAHRRPEAPSPPPGAVNGGSAPLDLPGGWQVMQFPEKTGVASDLAVRSPLVG